MADTRLADVAEELLAKLVDLLTAAGIDVPERAFVNAGASAHDFVGANCVDQLILSWNLLSQGEIGVGAPAGAIRCSMPLACSLTIELLRCVPTFVQTAGGKVKAPSESELHDAGVRIMTDAMTLADVVVGAATKKTLFADEFTTVAIGQLNSFGPQGGVGGTVMTLFVNLSGRKADGGY